MTRFGMRLGLLCILALAGRAGAMTIQLGSETVTLVEAGRMWHYLAGAGAPSEPAEAWTEVEFDDSAWPVGPAGFGFGDNDDATVLADMQDRYVTLYIRTMFSVSTPVGDGALELEILLVVAEELAAADVGCLAAQLEPDVPANVVLRERALELFVERCMRGGITSLKVAEFRHQHHA